MSGAPSVGEAERDANVGADTSAYGSEIGPPFVQSAVEVPVGKVTDGVLGDPATANSLPVKFGPPFVRSTVPLPVQLLAELLPAAAHVELLELTCMLRFGPPTICTVLLPLTWKACLQVGLRTMIGTGAVDWSTPQTALAATSRVG